MILYVDLQLFADGEASDAAAENSAEGSDGTGREEENNTAAETDERSGTDIKAAEGPAEQNGEKAEGEEEISPREKDVRLVQSLEAALIEKLKNSQIKKITDDWEKSGEELKEIYPGFDLKKELAENEDFRDLLKAGVSVRRAYEAANLERILGSALRYAAVTAGRKTAQSVISQTGRVQENSLLDRASSLSRKDVNSLTKSDILKILDEVSRGATIKF